MTRLDKWLWGVVIGGTGLALTLFMVVLVAGMSGTGGGPTSPSQMTCDELRAAALDNAGGEAEHYDLDRARAINEEAYGRPCAYLYD